MVVPTPCDDVSGNANGAVGDLRTSHVHCSHANRATIKASTASKNCPCADDMAAAPTKPNVARLLTLPNDTKRILNIGAVANLNLTVSRA